MTAMVNKLFHGTELNVWLPSQMQLLLGTIFKILSIIFHSTCMIFAWINLSLMNYWEQLKNNFLSPFLRFIPTLLHKGNYELELINSSLKFVSMCIFFPLLLYCHGYLQTFWIDNYPKKWNAILIPFLLFP